MQTDQVSETQFSVGNSLPDDGRSARNQEILIVSIFILLSLLRRRMEAYETTTLLVHAFDLCIYVSYLNFRIFPPNFMNFGMGVMSSQITCLFYYFSTISNNNKVGVQRYGTGRTLAQHNLVHLHEKQSKKVKISRDRPRWPKGFRVG